MFRAVPVGWDEPVSLPVHWRVGTKLTSRTPSGRPSPAADTSVSLERPRPRLPPCQLPVRPHRAPLCLGN